MRPPRSESVVKVETGKACFGVEFSTPSAIDMKQGHCHRTVVHLPQTKTRLTGCIKEDDSGLPMIDSSSKTHLAIVIAEEKDDLTIRNCLYPTKRFATRSPDVQCATFDGLLPHGTRCTVWLARSDETQDGQEKADGY